MTNRRENLGKSRQIAQSCDEANRHSPEKHQEDTKGQPKQSSELFSNVTQSNISPVDIVRSWSFVGVHEKGTFFDHLEGVVGGGEIVEGHEGGISRSAVLFTGNQFKCRRRYRFCKALHMSQSRLGSWRECEC